MDSNIINQKKWVSEMASHKTMPLLTYEALSLFIINPPNAPPSLSNFEKTEHIRPCIAGEAFREKARREDLSQNQLHRPVDVSLNKMHRLHSLATMILDSDSFGVTVYPNVDYAFIVALVVILDEINADRSGED
uniref:Uncharacterized protein n=1 Tax=Salix viminalis TaxID=40686 RepID=A0A6N2KI10_SALVM